MLLHIVNIKYYMLFLYFLRHMPKWFVSTEKMDKYMHNIIKKVVNKFKEKIDKTKLIM